MHMRVKAELPNYEMWAPHSRQNSAVSSLSVLQFGQRIFITSPACGADWACSIRLTRSPNRIYAITKMKYAASPRIPKK